MNQAPSHGRSSEGEGLSTDALLRAVDRMQIFDLGRPLFNGMPQSPNHAPFWHSLARRHGDMVRADGGSAAADVVSMGCHVGTHIDALAHVSQDGLLAGGMDAGVAQLGGKFDQLGVDAIKPRIARGVLLDVPGMLGIRMCDPGFEITCDLLEQTAEHQGTPIISGEVVLVRSGWGSHWPDGRAYVGRESGVPGVGECAAEWLAQHGASMVGADSIAFERLPPGAGHALLPAHRVLLVEHGIPILESLNLDELANAQAFEFAVVVSPLPIVGATGSPVRPLAVRINE